MKKTITILTFVLLTILAAGGIFFYGQSQPKSLGKITLGWNTWPGNLPYLVAYEQGFFKEQGLHIYNKIVYLECEFTRLAHAKRTLHYRKFPKREQKILIFYKGDMQKIKDRHINIGRL